MGNSQSEVKAHQYAAGSTSASGDAQDDFSTSLKENLQRLIIYAKSSDPALQQEVAERLANEAVRAERQRTIVEAGAVQLLVPLSLSADANVRRLAAHCMANLSVAPENQVVLAQPDVLAVLLRLMSEGSEPAIAKQAAKAVANLAVLAGNKRLLADAGVLPPLVALAAPTHQAAVRVEAVAALANLAVDDTNEALIGSTGLPAIIDGAGGEHEELRAQCARALRNLSVNKDNQEGIKHLGGVPILQRMHKSGNDRERGQASRALVNLGLLEAGAEGAKLPV